MSDREDQLSDLADKLARLEQLENEFQFQLEQEKLEALAEFAAGAGHEINNPLTVISGRAQLLLRDETDPERRHALALIIAQVKRVHEMIADMMLFARPPQPEIKIFDLLELIDSIIRDFSDCCNQQDIKIARNAICSPLVIEGDPVQLNVAFRAICRNALEAIGHGGNIFIEVVGDDSEVTVSVIDDGPGMKPYERRHAFDPFYSARQAGRGLGFGLSKAWRIITSHGGRIDIEDASQGGTVVKIVLKRPGCHLQTNHQ